MRTTYIPSFGIQCVLLIMWDFYLLVLQNSKKISIPKNILILNTQCCKTEKQTVY